MAQEPSGQELGLELLYPFYLDTDMSMAFAAALAGGVALEAEQLDRSDQTSEAVKNLRGNLRLFGGTGLLGLAAGSESSETSGATTESRLIRRHTVASIFIGLYDELRRTGQVTHHPPFEEMSTGDIVSAHMGPAVAPLKRVVDQVIRLLDVAMPMLSNGEPPATPARGGSGRQQKRSARRETQPTEDSSIESLRQVHRLFIALRDDLEQSGMVDILVSQEGAPSVVLTLDRRFISGPVLELLHTSAFTVVGKVTNLWQGPDDAANLYRRSVVSLVPALTQTTAWGLFTLLGMFARGLDVSQMERMAREALGIPANQDAAPPDNAEPMEGQREPRESAAAEGRAESATEQESALDEPLFAAETITALAPMVTGPAFQILPLALCS